MSTATDAIEEYKARQIAGPAPVVVPPVLVKFTKGAAFSVGYFGFFGVLCAYLTVAVVVVVIVVAIGGVAAFSQVPATP